MELTLQHHAVTSSVEIGSKLVKSFTIPLLVCLQEMQLFLELLFPNHVWIFQQLDRNIILSQFYEGCSVDKCHFITLFCYRLGDIFESVHKASCCREKCTGANVDTQVVQPFVALNDV